MNEKKCPIWDTPAEYYPRSFDGEEIYSARAGGHFRITGSALAVIKSKLDNNVAKAKFSLLISDNQALPESLLITTETLEEVLKRPEIRPYDKADRILRFIAKNTTALNVAGLRWGAAVDPAERAKALAAAGLINSGELEAILEFLVRKGFCLTKIDQRSGEGFVWLTLEGAETVAASASASESNRAFVAMWFSKETQPAFDFGIVPALTELGYVPIRIDQKEHNNKIDDEIISEIRKSRFLVADFTCGIAADDDQHVAIARGGVYFEAGFAMGLGIPIIWSCREDLINHVHFDTRQYNHITWNSPDDLLNKLRNRVGAVIGPYKTK